MEQVYSIVLMIAFFVTGVAAVLGLAFGSFLNVCVARWPESESIVSPRSHCRSCGRTLAWHENIPVASWIALRGQCRSCRIAISYRYPLVELLVGLTWAIAAWQAMLTVAAQGAPSSQWLGAGIFTVLLFAIEKMILCWLLIGLAVLDAAHFWLPDRLTLGGAALGIPFAFFNFVMRWFWPISVPQTSTEWAAHHAVVLASVVHWAMALVVAPGIILVTRWTYRMARHREGIGLGDAKLMLLMAVWLGLAHTLLAFVLGVLLGAIVAAAMLLVSPARRGSETWALTRLPLGSCLCVGGIVSALWGNPLVSAYLRLVGF
jgi:leader peptidase (prepilin peptidase) / N-methyltransferase